MERATSNKRPVAPTIPINCINVWESLENRSQFIDRAINGSYEKNIFYLIHEWGIEHHLTAIDYTLESLNDALQQKNSYLDIVESSYNPVPHPSYSNIRIHKFPIWFLIESTVARWSVVGQHINPKDMDSHLLDKTDFTYNFCSLNNRPHPHRCLLMDILAKHNLIDRGAISYREVADYNQPPYNFTYFDGKTRLLSDWDHETNWPDYRVVAKEVEDSYIQLVSESTFDEIFITEKTAIRMLNYKPFIVSAAPGFYKVMDELGYLRYDELFDYSFDTVEDDVYRTELVVKNVLRFSNLSRVQKLEAIQSVKPKLIHNFNKTLQYAFDIDKWHPLLLEPIKYYEETGINLCEAIVNAYITVKNLKTLYNL